MKPARCSFSVERLLFGQVTDEDLGDRRSFWSGRRDSNPRPQPWQGCALPLSYTRIQKHGGFAVARLICQKARSFATAMVVGVTRRQAAEIDKRPNSIICNLFSAMAATPDDLFAFLDRL